MVLHLAMDTQLRQQKKLLVQMYCSDGRLNNAPSMVPSRFTIN